MASLSSSTSQGKLPQEILNPEQLEQDRLTGILPSVLSLKEAKEHQNDFWKERLSDLEDFSVSNCLVKHEVKPAHRSAMVNWMIEVLQEFTCETLTIFKAVAIMDLFYARSPVYVFSFRR